MMKCLTWAGLRVLFVAFFIFVVLPMGRTWDTRYQSLRYIDKTRKNRFSKKEYTVWKDNCKVRLQCYLSVDLTSLSGLNDHQKSKGSFDFPRMQKTYSLKKTSKGKEHDTLVFQMRDKLWLSWHTTRKPFFIASFRFGNCYRVFPSFIRKK